jgi:hypothetical protein
MRFGRKTHLANVTEFKDLAARLLDRIDRNGEKPGADFQAFAINDLP